MPCRSRIPGLYDFPKISVIKSSRVCLATVGVSNLPSFYIRAVRGRKLKKILNGSKITQKSRREDNAQVKCDLTVLFSLISIFNLLEWVTCGEIAYYWAIQHVRNGQMISPPPSPHRHQTYCRKYLQTAHYGYRTVPHKLLCIATVIYHLK